MWSGILSLLPTAGWLITKGQSVATNLEASQASVWPTIFAGLAFVGFATMVVANFIAHRERPLTKDSATLNAVAPQFKNVDDFYRAYTSRMLNETEDLVRKEAAQYVPPDRERFLTRVAAALMTLLIFERAWLTSLGSQLRALDRLNIEGMKTHAQMRAFYEEGAQREPEFYKTVSFEAWLGSLRNFLLIREHDAEHFEITIRGQDFLRHLVESRYDPTTRRG